MLAAIRIRGGIGKREEVLDTLDMLGMKKPNTLAILPRSDSIIGMLRKAEGMITWGEIDQEILDRLQGKKVVHLKSPEKGFRSIKKLYPKGDLGYRGKEINELIKRMM